VNSIAVNQYNYDPSFVDRLAASAALAGVLLAATACTSEGSRTTAPASPVATGYNPKGPCAPNPTISPEQAATRCQAATQDGTVVIVNFAGANVTTEQADSAEKLANIASGGLVHVNIGVVAASLEAEAALTKTLGGKSCIDSTNPKRYASTAADTTMPQLAAQNFVIGVTTNASCQNKALGVADQLQGRRADLFLGTSPESTADNEKKQEVITIVHELLHLYQLGHSGQLFGRDVHGQGFVNFSGNNAYRIGTDFDLKAYLAGCRYDEFGVATDPMGSMTVDEPLQNIHPNPLHSNRLMQPQVVLDKALPKARPMTAEWSVFSAAAVRTGQLGTATLVEPRIFKNGADPGVVSEGLGSHTFDTIAFVPQFGDGVVWGIEVYLYDSTQGNSATLGYLGGRGTSRLSYGSQIFEIGVDGNSAQMRVLAA
jgi:hypothetical protein